MKSMQKPDWDSGRTDRKGGNPNPFESSSLLIVLPGGGSFDLKNPGAGGQARDADSLYYPLFPTVTGPLKKETYRRAHERLMAEMRAQLRLKNRRGIEKTGRKLHRLRKRYRMRFAA